MKFVAKIASDLAKPNGQLEVPAEGSRRVPGAAAGRAAARASGPRARRELDALGLRTIGDLAAKDAAFLERRLGPGGPHLRSCARGIDPRPVIADRDAKSVGAEETFDEDLAGVEALRPRIHAQALRVAHRLRRAGLRARTVQLKLKRTDFTIVTRRVTLDEPTDDGQTIYREAARLLEREPARPTRLSGVSAQNLTAAAAPQLGLFAPPPRRPTPSTARSTPIASRFGGGAITTGDVAASDRDDPDHRAPPPSEIGRRKA